MKVGAIIPCRMRASRLPGKPLLDVGGRTAMERVVARVQACSRVERVIIATTAEPDDDRLCAFAEHCGVDVFRGSTDDVLQRIARAALTGGLDAVVEVDGDDLLCAEEYMERGLELVLGSEVDYLSFTGLPLGITPSILRTEALERAMKIKPPSDTSTGFFRFLQESGQFQVAKVAANNPAHRHPTARLTLDYPQDLIFFSEVYRVLDERGGGWDLAGLVALLHDRPDFVALNQGLDEAYWQHFETGVTKGFSA